MSRRVKSVAVLVFTLSLSLSAPVASALPTRGGEPGFFERIVLILKKVVKPMMPTSQGDNDFPTPPKP